MEEIQEILIPPEKRKQMIKDLKLFLLLYVQSTCVCDTYKMEYDKNNNLLDSENENYLNLFI